MSERSKSGSHEAYRQHGDRHDLAESFETFWEIFAELAEQRQACLGALVVANRDGVLEESVARDLAEGIDLSDESGRPWRFWRTNSAIRGQEVAREWP